MGKIRWTPELCLQIKARLEAKETVGDIAKHFKVSLSTMYNAIDNHGLRQYVIKPVVAPRAPVAERQFSAPMPAGHSVSWGAITDGTLLDGLRYPLIIRDARTQSIFRTM